MPRKPSRPRTPPPTFTSGAQISLDSWYSGDLAVDETGSAYCYVGYQNDLQPYGAPYQEVAVARRDPKARDSDLFVRLFGGTLFLSPFLQEDRFYHVLRDRRLVLPGGSDSYFGVTRRDDQSEDAELTRQLFGGTHEEITALARTVARVTGRVPSPMGGRPHLTFSRSRNNTCDLSGCLIPREFPYVAFEAAEYVWGHVSLYGLYRLLGFLCPDADRSPMGSEMVKLGIDSGPLKTFVDCAHQGHRALQPRE